MKFRKSTSENNVNNGLPDLLIKTLQSLEVESLVLIPGEEVLFQSNGISTFGLIRDERITSEDLLALIRVVRRKNEIHRGTLELARGPIGGGKRQLDVSVSPLNDQGMVLVLISDESEARRIDAVRRDFVANVSHELKTPIGAISVLAETIEGETDDELVLRLTGRMVIEAQRMSRTIDDLLELSRIELGGEMLTVDIDMADVAAEAIERVSPIAMRKGVPLLLKSEKGIAVVSGDFFQLVSALANLVENAVKYSDQTHQVDVRVLATDTAVLVEVEDRGIGIPADSIDRIFERFYRVDRARNRATGGTGLGLSIVRHVATNHGGEVNVRSREGEGSTFILQIPRVLRSV